jgi:hypothetical protein
LRLQAASRRSRQLREGIDFPRLGRCRSIDIRKTRFDCLSDELGSRNAALLGADVDRLDKLRFGAEIDDAGVLHRSIH